MVEIISNLIKNEYWATLIMSVVPLIEIKGAIVFAQGLGFDFFTSLALAYIGSTIVVVPVYFLLKPLLNLLKKIKFVSGIAEKAECFCQDKATQAIEKHKENGKTKELSETRLKQFGIFIFVAIPLPMTGIWMGTAIAAFLDLEFKYSVLPIILGNLVAGLIISVLAFICSLIWTIAVLDYILYVLFALAIVMLIIMIIKVALSKPKKDVK